MIQRVEDGLIPDIYHLSKWKHLQDFDDAYTAPAGGFKDRHDYYATCSAAPHLHKIRTPVAVITSQDDPFVDYRGLMNAAKSEWVHTHFERHGGHMGYISRGVPEGRWLTYALEHYMRQLA